MLEKAWCASRIVGLNIRMTQTSGISGCLFTKGFPAVKSGTFLSYGIALDCFPNYIIPFHLSRPPLSSSMTYTISCKTCSVLSLQLCLWIPCLISIKECPSWVRAGRQEFVFCIQYACFIQRLCCVVQGGEKCSNWHFIQHRTMMQSDLWPTQS